MEKKSYGRTREWALNEINWKKYKTMYEISIQKLTNKMMNIENEHRFTNYMMLNRGTRAVHENKVGPHKKDIGMNNCEQKSFLYANVAIYNKLPKELTMIQNPDRFRIWLKRFYNKKEIRIKITENADIMRPSNAENDRLSLMDPISPPLDAGQTLRGRVPGQRLDDRRIENPDRRLPSAGQSTDNVTS